VAITAADLVFAVLTPAGRAITLIRGARVFDGDQLREAVLVVNGSCLIPGKLR
jgi:hypothetical protein